MTAVVTDLKDIVDGTESMDAETIEQVAEVLDKLDSELAVCSSDS